VEEFKKANPTPTLVFSATIHMAKKAKIVKVFAEHGIFITNSNRLFLLGLTIPPISYLFLETDF
jgi:hypothetical protein